ncbi:pheromone A receptor-domain-containing protein [Mycena sanguinolenta]|nr:pheromone A receptor-domain-containing protein [Mycena sanguinolenta]
MILIGASFALPAACLCICIHLEQVSSVCAARTAAADKRRPQIFEALVCFGLPIFFMALHYVVHGHHFDIIEQYGGRPTTDLSVLAIMLISVIPLILGGGALVFVALALQHVLARCLTFLAHLSSESSPSGLPLPGTSHDDPPHFHLIAPDGLGFGDHSVQPRLHATLHHYGDTIFIPEGESDE